MEAIYHELIPDEKLTRIILERIAAAEKEILFTVYCSMFALKKTGSPVNKIIEELKRAKDRGICVMILLNKRNFSGKLGAHYRRFKEKITEYGIINKENKTRLNLHCKIWAFDREYVIIGSHNMTDKALERQHEVSVLIRDKLIAQKMIDYYFNIFNKN